MIFELQTILDLRRDAENNAKRALELASARLLSEEAEQGRLTERAQAAQATLTTEIRRMGRGSAASTAEQGLARESYLRRLREEAARLRAAAEEHANAALAAARSSHEQATRSYEAALREREAMSKLEQRSKEAARRTAARRAEDEAMDLANSRRR